MDPINEPVSLRMSAPDAAGPVTMDAARSESLRQGVIHTSITGAVAWGMVGIFLAGIISVPLSQIALQRVRGQKLQELEIAAAPAEAIGRALDGQVRLALRTLRWWLRKDNLSRYEERLTEASVVRRAFRPRVQYLLSRYLGLGNPMAFIATRGWRPNGWLFYHMGTDYIAGPGLLDPAFIRHRQQEFLDDGQPDVNANPVPAIVRFHADCQRAGIHLVVVPIPVKQMIQPAEMARRAAFAESFAVPNNSDYGRLLTELRQAGVDVFDPTPARLWPGEQPRFLPQDTHWTPQWMESVASALADHLRQTATLPPPSRPFSVRVVEEQVSRVGDIVDTLGLPSGQDLFPPRTVTLHRVIDSATGQDWQPSLDADVLLLGDSFSNIYSAEAMGWGRAAGFPQQISRFLGRDLDLVARNGEAASSVRQELAQRAHPLRGKRVVIWQFAMHELTASNWQIIPVTAD